MVERIIRELKQFFFYKYKYKSNKYFILYEQFNLIN